MKSPPNAKDEFIENLLNPNIMGHHQNHDHDKSFERTLIKGPAMTISL